MKIANGTIVDATIIGAPSSTKNTDGKRDPEMHQTAKGKQWYFGSATVLRRWLQAGYIEMDILFATKAGTPRRSRSPVFANMTLDGLEVEVLSSVVPTERTRSPFKMHVVRYADDLP